MSHHRERIRERVATHPGEHFNALTRALDLAPGQVQYHLKTLRREGQVVEERLYGRTHYYTPEYDAWERGAIAVLRRETARDVLLYLLEEGPSSPATVADALDVARSTLEWHLDHLTDQGLVEKRRDDRNRVTLAVPRPAEAVRLLDEITPSLSDRLVDRFTRLVDRFLAE
ncbi:MAG: winged helix-turn-helix transcriptional regulator [Haloferacaceae archaeon]